jgi:hypothetical protein
LLAGSRYDDDWANGRGRKRRNQVAAGDFQRHKSRRNRLAEMAAHRAIVVRGRRQMSGRWLLPSTIRCSSLMLVVPAFASIVLTRTFRQPACLADLRGRFALMVMSHSSNERLDPLQGDRQGRNQCSVTAEHADRFLGTRTTPLILQIRGRTSSAIQLR